MKFLTYFILANFAFFQLNCTANEFSFATKKADFKNALKEFNLIKAREIVTNIKPLRLTGNQWRDIRDIIHSHPQIGFDILLKFDQSSPRKSHTIDRIIKKCDDFTLAKSFRSAAICYQLILKEMTKNKSFKSGRNYHLYWTLIHSLARAFYALKQYNEAFSLYETIPSSYPYYRQVQFELMWNHYMNERLEYSLGAIATMASGHFSKMLEPEVYLIQHYIYRRMCRDEEVELIRKQVKHYHTSLNKGKISFNDWMKSDVETLTYRQILSSDQKKSIATNELQTKLKARMTKDLLRLKNEFNLVLAYMNINAKRGAQLKPITSLLTVDQLLSTDKEKWTVEDGEIWLDELGKQVFIQKDLCNKETSK